MEAKRRSYTAAHRRDAAHLVLDTGRPIAHVAKRSASARHCWAAGSRSSAPRWTTRHRRWTPMNAPSSIGCAARSPSSGWIASS